MSADQPDRQRRLRASSIGGGRPAALRFFRFLLLAAASCALAAGGLAAFVQLRGMWLSQCRVTDVKSQVKVFATPHVGEELVLSLLGITNGCNLAEADFSAARERILREQPLIHRLEIVRRLPARLEISVEERKPVARVNYAPMKIRDSRGVEIDHGRWDVVDAEGMVFNFSRDDTKMLPMIREARPSAKRGERLSGRALAALRLVDMCASREFANLAIRDVNVSNSTYLKAATGDYDALEIDWTFIDDRSADAEERLRQALRNISDICKNRLSGPLRSVFIVTESGRVNMRPYDREGDR